MSNKLHGLYFIRMSHKITILLDIIPTLIILFFSLAFWDEITLNVYTIISFIEFYSRNVITRSVKNVTKNIIVVPYVPNNCVIIEFFNTIISFKFDILKSSASVTPITYTNKLLC